MNKLKKKDIATWLLKFVLSATALFFVFRIVDPDAIFEAIFSADPFYLLLAFLAFTLSKVLSAFRLNHYYSAIGVKISQKYNLLLYYIGMFYNLFLPGSVGGDAYKVYLLRQQGLGGTKKLLLATLMDRLSGLAFLVLLTFGLVLFSSRLMDMPYIGPLSFSGLLLTLPLFWIVNRRFFPELFTVILPTLHLSFWVQLGQLLCAFFILLAIGVEVGYLDYLILFMVSSVVAVLPFTLGGVGARELVFLYGYQYLLIEERLAIAFTFLFFTTLAVSSLAGLALSLLPLPESGPSPVIADE